MYIVVQKRYGQKTEKKSILFMNIQEYSKKFVTILIALKSSITLWGQKNDICTSKKLEKIYGIQPKHMRELELPGF